MRKYAIALFLFVFAVLPFTALAQTAGGTAPIIDLTVVIPQIMAAIQGHHWLVVIGLGLATIVAVALSHKAGISKAVPWFGTDAGGTMFTFLVAAIGAISTTLVAGQSLSALTAQAALGVGVVAIGGYTGLRKLLGTSGGLGAKFPKVAAFMDAFGPAQKPSSSECSNCTATAKAVVPNS